MPNPTQQLDQDAVRLAKAIRFTESGDNANAKGASGEHGLYQFMPDTWNSTTKEFNLDPSDFSRENQNKAAYMRIKTLKDQGYKPDQIAAYWNMGGNALTKGYEGNVGVNKYGVKYDTPAYVKSVKGAYQHLEENPTGIPTEIGPSTVGHEQFGTPDAPPDTRNFGQKAMDMVNGVASNVANFAAPTAVEALGKNLSAGYNAAKGLVNVPGALLGDKGSQSRLDQSIAQDKYLQTASMGENIGAGVELGLNVGAGPGGAGAKAAGLVENLAVKQAEKKTLQTAIDIASPKGTAAVTKAAIKSGRVDPSAITGANAIKDLVKRGVVKAGEDSATILKNADAIRNEIGTTADTLVKNLKSMDVTPILQQGELDGLFKGALTKIGEDPTMVGNAGESAARIFSKFKSFLPQGQDITAADLLDARKSLDSWIQTIKPKAFDPTTENAVSIALRAIRQGANGLVASKAPGVAVEEMLKHQSALYDVLENVAAKGTKAVQQADEVAKMRGLSGIAARHPLVTKLAKRGAEGALVALGFHQASKVLGD